MAAKVEFLSPLKSEKSRNTYECFLAEFYGVRYFQRTDNEGRHYIYAEAEFASYNVYRKVFLEYIEMGDGLHYRPVYFVRDAFNRPVAEAESLESAAKIIRRVSDEIGKMLKQETKIFWTRIEKEKAFTIADADNTTGGE